MAKELPYFKFEPNAWDNGNIQMLSREDKGLFIDICSMYWSRLGNLPKKLVIRKLCAGNAAALDSLCDEGVMEIENENIFIEFLTIQLAEFENISTQNSENAKERWRKHREKKDSCDRNATVLNPESGRNAIREEKRKEEEIKEEDTHNPDFEISSSDKINSEERKKVARKKERPEPPDIDAFVLFAQQIYQDELKRDFSPFEFAVRSKYESWINAGWKDGNGKDIINWKSKLKNTIPHLKAIYNNGNSNNPKPNTSKISGHQYTAGKLREHFTANSAGGDYSIDVEAIEQR